VSSSSNFSVVQNIPCKLFVAAATVVWLSATSSLLAQDEAAKVRAPYVSGVSREDDRTTATLLDEIERGPGYAVFVSRARNISGRFGV